MRISNGLRRPAMWRVRESKKIGTVTFWEVYKVFPGGDTIFRGKWTDFKEAQRLADNLNRREAERERI